jgi:hypothetical protein
MHKGRFDPANEQGGRQQLSRSTASSGHSVFLEREKFFTKSSTVKTVSLVFSIDYSYLMVTGRLQQRLPTRSSQRFAISLQH